MRFLNDRLRRLTQRYVRDTSGIAATEFAIIVPMMLILFFGVLEISNGVAVDRKTTRVARALSDLTTQSQSVDSNDLKNFFAASGAVMAPYTPVPVQATLSQIYIDNNKVAKIQWSTSATITSTSGQTSATLKASTRNVGDVVTVDSNLSVKDTYLIWSEVSYKYTPVVGYIIKNGVTLSDQTYTRPRQSLCVPYVVSASQTLGDCS